MPFCRPLALAALLSTVTPGGARAKDLKLDRLQWSKDVDGPSPITVLEVRNDFGDIRLRRSGIPRIEAHAVVQRLDAEGAEVGFTVERRGPVVALVVAYPPGRIRDTDPDPPKDSYDRLDIAIHVPDSVAVRAHTLRGEIEAKRLRTDVDATTLDGPISMATTGSVRARTRAGAIHVALDKTALAHPGPPLILESVTGPITVTLPARPSVELRAETRGEIRSPLGLKHDRKRGRAAKKFGRHPNRLLLIRSADGTIRLLTEE